MTGAEISRLLDDRKAAQAEAARLRDMVAARDAQIEDMKRAARAAHAACQARINEVIANARKIVQSELDALRAEVERARAAEKTARDTAKKVNSIRRKEREKAAELKRARVQPTAAASMAL